MGRFKQLTEDWATGLLRRAGVPAAQLHSRMRKTGQALLILSILVVIPLIIMDNASMVVTILLQTAYGILVCLGGLLAFEEKEKPRP